MATSMWRMNGPCRRMTGLVVLCTLLLSSVVMCQQTAATNASAESASATVGADVSPATAPVSTANDNAATGSPSPVTTATQETTILIDSGSSKIVQAPAGPAIVKITEVTETQTDPSAPPSQSSPSPKSSGSSVFWGILVTGLLAILAITAGYFKCQSRSDTKGVKLAEEAYPVDQENQGNTLVSVAPLNPPPETQEKPNVNGESPEAAKTQPPPPTNGHSTTKTADTEL